MFYKLKFQVDIAIEDIKQLQSNDTVLEICKSSLRMMSPLEEQAHDIITLYAFKLFQKRVRSSTSIYNTLHENECEFLVQYYKETSST